MYYIIKLTAGEKSDNPQHLVKVLQIIVNAELAEQAAQQLHVYITNWKIISGPHPSGHQLDPQSVLGR